MSAPEPSSATCGRCGFTATGSPTHVIDAYSRHPCRTGGVLAWPDVAALLVVFLVVLGVLLVAA
jgi:hypothetical protein